MSSAAKKRFFSFLSTFFLLSGIIFFLVIGIIIYLEQSLPSIPNYKDFQSRFTSSDRLLLDRNHKPLHEIRIDHHVRRMAWTSLNSLSEKLQESVLLAEDQRFFYHFGVDPLALLHAFIQRLRSSSHRGASTITMQVSEYIESPSGKKRIHRGFKEKIKQILLALELEKNWNKNQILEAYLNLLQFKGELQGISSTSYGLFGKNPRHLNLYEIAVLTVLIRSPNANTEKLYQRACRHIQFLYAQPHSQQKLPQKICGSDLQLVIRQVMQRHQQIQSLASYAPHVARQLQISGEFKNNNQVITTLDLSLQKQVTESLRKHVLGLKDQNMNDGAAVVLDNATGEVLAYIGNIGPKSSAVFVDGAKALRQAGSTLKPFIYALSFDRKLLTPASIIDDTPLEISVSNGMYRPQNYDRGFKNKVSVRNALASSLNIPSVKALEMVGVSEVVDLLSSLGFTDLERPDFYGPSLALGSADVRLIELINAYRTLANEGIWSPIRWILKENIDSKPAKLITPQMGSVPKNEEVRNLRIFTAETSYLIADILSDREARSSTFGLENMLATRFWTAVKTGTSKDMRDNWCIGFSSRYTVGVWTGNFSGSPMWNISGIQGAAPIWLEIMNYLHQNEASSVPKMPPGIVQKNIEFIFSKQKKLEKFLVGTDPPDGKVRLDTHSATKIAYPQANSYIALDPDIPLRNQKLFFNIMNPNKNHYLTLNKIKLGPAQSFVLWRPQRGKFQLELKDQSGATLDQVEFEVRGKNL